MVISGVGEGEKVKGNSMAAIQLYQLSSVLTEGLLLGAIDLRKPRCDGKSMQKRERQGDGN